MLIDITRSRFIQAWFVTFALVVASGMALGVRVTLGSGAMLLAFCLVPPAIVLMLWPVGDTSTVAEVLHDADRRG
jgi:hypothetical protein